MSVLAIFIGIFVVSVVQGGTPLPNNERALDQVIRATDVPGDYRLPADSRPISYKLALNVSFKEDFAFTGNLTIQVAVTKITKQLTLHAQNLTIDGSVLLVDAKDKTKQFTPDKVIVDTIYTFLNITFKVDIPVATYNLIINYNGTLSDQLRGFYKTSYVNKVNKEKWMGSTHFEPLGARLAFPCYDEPALKATFQISITCDKKYTVLSNTNEESSTTDTKGNVLKTTNFRQTPPMSTYLVAFVIAEYDVEGSEFNPGFQVSARKDAMEHGQYALEFGPKVLEALNNYTNIPYVSLGIEKIDSVALPAMSAGAMENWGLVIYTEKGLLVENNVTSTIDKEGVAKIIAHEFAHQWFGNSLTPQWWTYVWLSEGFANYFQYYIVDQLEPQWRLMERLVVENLQSAAFSADSVKDSHAMDSKTDTPSQILNAFDKITYSKAGSVIRMMSHVIGQEKFKKGLQNYLTTNKQKSVTSDNLITEMTKVAPEIKSFSDILKNWITTPGFPVLNVTRNYTTNMTTISQSRFLYNQTDNVAKTTYWVPINYVTGSDLNFNDTKPTAWLNPSNVLSTPIQNLPNNTFVIFNKQQFGYYRVNYDTKNWMMISEFLGGKNFSKIHVVNRAQLIDDALNLARAGLLQYNVTFAIVRYLKQETDYLPWLSAWNNFEHLKRLLANTKNSQSFKNYTLELSNQVLTEVGFVESANDTNVKKLCRMRAIKWACTVGSENCLNNATEKLNQWLNNSEVKLSSDLKEIIICAGLQKADENIWNKVLGKYLSEGDTSVVSALGCSINAVILKNYLTLASNKTFGVEQIPAAFRAIYSSTNEGVNVALDFIVDKNNIKAMLELQGVDASLLKKYILGLGEFITTEPQYEKFKTFIKANEKDFEKDAADKASASAENNVNWIKAHDAELELVFKKDSDNGGGGGKPDSAITFTVSIFALIGSLIISQLY